RTGDQSKNSQTDWTGHSTERAGESGSGDQVKAAVTTRSKQIGLYLLVVAFGFVSAEAQQLKKVPRIGILSSGSASTEAPRFEALRQGLRDLGDAEGKNIVIEYRYADGKLERLPELAQELLSLSVDILVVSSGTVASAAKKSSTTVPIVMVNSGDPIGRGLVSSLARPGGNITGLYMYSPELIGKRLEVLKEIVPKIFRFAFLDDTRNPGNQRAFAEARRAASALAVKLERIQVESNRDIEQAF